MAVPVATIVNIGIPSSEPAHAIDGVSMARSSAAARVLPSGHATGMGLPPVTALGVRSDLHRLGVSLPCRVRRFSTKVRRCPASLMSTLDVRRSSPGPSDSPVSVPLLR
jgi:hypothetical protein